MLGYWTVTAEVKKGALKVRSLMFEVDNRGCRLNKQSTSNFERRTFGNTRGLTAPEYGHLAKAAKIGGFRFYAEIIFRGRFLRILIVLSSSLTYNSG
jgi:hypothetical protein